MSDKPGSVPPPLCKAILMCRSVGIDPTTGTYNLYGVLDGCELRALPGPTFPFTVFLSLTGSQGEQELWIEVHDLRDGQIVYRSEKTSIPFEGREESVFARLECSPIVLPAPGQYDLVVFSAVGEIDRLKFTAAPLEE